MSVNSIRKHCTDEEVIALAKVLIKDWKRLLGELQNMNGELMIWLICWYFDPNTHTDSGQSPSEKPPGVKNGLDSNKTVSPSCSPSDTQGRSVLHPQVVNTDTKTPWWHQRPCLLPYSERCAGPEVIRKYSETTMEAQTVPICCRVFTRKSVTLKFLIFNLIIASPHLIFHPKTAVRRQCNVQCMRENIRTEWEVIIRNYWCFSWLLLVIMWFEVEPADAVKMFEYSHRAGNKEIKIKTICKH